MRRSSILTIALALACPCVAAAQATPPSGGAQPEAGATGSTPWTGRFDFGVRGTSLDGDAARYERYRDLGDGLFLEHARAHREYKGWLVDFTGEHVGRRDQRYIANVLRPGRVRGSFMWDQIPMLLSLTTQTLFSGIGTGELAIDDAIQAAAQLGPARMVTLFDQFAQRFELRTRRHIADGRFEYAPSVALTFQAAFRHTNREGTIPFGGSFGHGALVELPAPTQFDLSQFEGGAEYVRTPWLLRAGYTGSWFHNDVTELAFDNPYRAVDIPTASSRGRLGLAPTNSQFAVNGLASVKLPYRSRATAYASIGMLEDAGDPLMPQTINTANVTQPIDRGTVDGEARTSAVNLAFVSRPRRDIDVDIRYRAYNFDNRTGLFTLSERVSYDNAPAAVVRPVHTEPQSIFRDTFDADLRWMPGGRTSAGVGYTRLADERTHRIYESTTDNVLRLTFDTLGHQWFTLRTKYEHGERRGEGIEQGVEELIAIGEQPGMRHFDVAPRDRNRVTVLGSLTATQNLSANLSLAVGKDDYLQSEFGLRDNTHRVYTAGGDVVATDRITLRLSYSFEEYEALSRSRQANPGPQFTDPSRNWAADTSDRVHSVLFDADVARIAGKIDLHLAYDFSRGRAIYNYITGPVSDRTLPEEVIVPTTLPTPTELPPTLSELQRGTADATYTLNARLSVGLSYWYEQFRVRDWTLDIDANPELVRGQALLMGYMYRPYTAHTFWARLVYGW